MQRKEFLKSCGFACIGGLAGTTLLPGCFAGEKAGAGSTAGNKPGAGASAAGEISGDQYIVPLSVFELSNGKGYRKSVILRHQLLKFPICVFRFGPDIYSAVWMQCAHQGAELQVFGDTLQCPAHGSEFDNKGLVQNGPADQGLRSFPIRIDDQVLNISLKAETT